MLNLSAKKIESVKYTVFLPVNNELDNQLLAKPPTAACCF